MNILHCKAQLHEPIHNLSFSKMLSFGLLFPDMIRQVSMFTKLHYDNQYALLYEGMLV